MVHLSRAEFNRIVRDQRAKAAAKKAKREEKRATLPWGNRPKRRTEKRTTIAHASSKGALKASIVTLLGLLDRKLNGPNCRLGHLCPAYKDLGNHPGQVGYHLIPQKRGDAARFLQENVVWACSRANNGERWNRDLYRHHHITIFGQARIERLGEISREKRHYSMADLREIKDAVKAQLEAPLIKENS